MEGGIVKKARDGDARGKLKGRPVDPQALAGVQALLGEEPRRRDLLIEHLHKIQDRAVPLNGQVVIRPMMYVALSYDHRLVDGREAVQFLVKVKEYVEEPGNLLLES